MVNDISRLQVILEEKKHVFKMNERYASIFERPFLHCFICLGFIL